MLIILRIDIPIYICATTLTFVAASLLLKGTSLGAMLVFLLANPVTAMMSVSVFLEILGTAGIF